MMLLFHCFVACQKSCLRSTGIPGPAASSVSDTIRRICTRAVLAAGAYVGGALVDARRSGVQRVEAEAALRYVVPWSALVSAAVPSGILCLAGLRTRLCSFLLVHRGVLRPSPCTCWSAPSSVSRAAKATASSSGLQLLWCSIIKKQRRSIFVVPD